MPEDRYTNRELLEKLLLSTVIFSSTEKDTVIELVPELEQMVGCAQNHPAHVYDVFEHTIKVVEGIECDLILKLVALLHDTGKPFVKTIGNDGFDHFFGHEGTGSEICGRVLVKLGYDKDFIKRICLIIKYHDMPTKPTAESITRTAALVGKENIDYLFRFQMADLKGHEEGYGNRKIKELTEVISLYKDWVSILFPYL